MAYNEPLMPWIEKFYFLFFSSQHDIGPKADTGINGIERRSQIEDGTTA